MEHGPGGVVWSSAAVHLQVGDRLPPFVLAYVDLAGSDGAAGPRVLARVGVAAELLPGMVVAITGTDEGDIVVEPVLVSPDDCAGTSESADVVGGGGVARGPGLDDGGADRGA